MLDPKAIQNNHLVYGLSNEDLACLAEIASERTFGPGETLCRQGDVGTDLFIVLSGRLSVRFGEGEQLAELTAGSVVGEMGLVEPRNRSATVVAVETSEVAAISQTDLRQLLVTDGNLGFIVLCNITRVLSDRLRQTDEKLGTLMSTAIQAAP